MKLLVPVAQVIDGVNSGSSNHGNMHAKSAPASVRTHESSVCDHSVLTLTQRTSLAQVKSSPHAKQYIPGAQAKSTNSDVNTVVPLF